MLGMKQQVAVWKRAFGSIFYRVNRMIVDSSTLQVKFVNDDKIPSVACSDYKNVIFNGHHLDKYIEAALTDDEAMRRLVTAMKGANYHEVGHILWTMPFDRMVAHSTLPYARTAKTQMAWNILEDGRIERMLVAQYPIMADYFRRMYHTFVSNVTEQLKQRNQANVNVQHEKRMVVGRAFAWSWGRRYLGRKYREAARQAAQDLNIYSDVDQMAEIIDEFLTVVFPRDAERATELCVRFGELMWPQNEQPEDSDCMTGTPQRGQKVGDPDEEDQQEAQAAADEQEAEQESSEPDGGGSDADDDESDAETDSAAGGEADDESEDDEFGDGDGDDGDWKFDQDDESPEPQQKPRQQSAGKTKTVDEALDDLAEQSTDEIAGSDSAEFNTDVDKTANDIRSLVKSGGWQNRESEVVKSGTDVPCQSVETIVAQHTRRVLRELKDLARPGYQHNMDTGRLNVGAVMDSRGAHFEVFDQWRPGREQDTTAEVVLLIDKSSSMTMRGDYLSVACRAAWSIKRAMDTLGILCTVMAFSEANDHSMVYNRNSKANPVQYKRVAVAGGTDPVSALEEATLILHASKARHKMCVLVTDGEFNFDAIDPSREQFQLLNSMRVQTALIGIGEAQAWDASVRHGLYGAKSGQFFGTDIMGIPAYVRTVVNKMIGQSLGKERV